MPLKKGSSRSVVSSNISTMVDDWKEDGSIGASHPPTKKKAIMQAVAIALAKAANPQARSHAEEKPVEPWFIPCRSGDGVTSTVMTNFFAPLLLPNR